MFAVSESQQLFAPLGPALANGNRITSSERNEFLMYRARRGERAWDVLGRDISSKTDGAT